MLCDADLKFSYGVYGWPGKANDARAWRACALSTLLASGTFFTFPGDHQLWAGSVRVARRSLLSLPAVPSHVRISAAARTRRASPLACHDDGDERAPFSPSSPAQVRVKPYVITDGAFGAETHVLPSYNDAEVHAPGQLGSARRAFNRRHKPARSCVERAFGILKGRFRSLLKLDMKLDRTTPHIKACVALHNILISCREEFDERLFVPEDAGAGAPAPPAAPVVGAAAAAAAPNNGEVVRAAMAQQFLKNSGGVWQAAAAAEP
jgi:hypothetical protein